MTLIDTFRQTVLEHGKKSALVFGDQTWRYQDLDRITETIAANLAKAGVQRGDRVALLFGNSPELVFSYYACFKLGAIAVPLNIRLKAAELQYILNHAGAKFCLAQADLYAEIAGVRSELPTLQACFLTGDRSDAPEVQPFSTLLQTPDPSASLPPVIDAAVAAILYTSGTTARPKGVTHTHASLYHTVSFFNAVAGVTATDRLGAMLPLSHIFGFALQLLTAFSTGATLVLLPKFEPGLVLTTLEQQQVTKLCGLPVMYNTLVNYPQANHYRLDHLQFALAGGDAVPIPLQQRFQTLFGAPLIEGCGMTEVIPYCLNPVDGTHQPGSIGRAVSGMHLRLVNTWGEDVPVGTVGEILVQSEAATLGYWNDPEATAATIRDDWLHTGDRGRIDENGFYWFEGRQKELIICGGSNISPLEVEAALYEHPAIWEAGVVGVPNPTLGETVQAYVALHPGEWVTETHLKQFLQSRLATYKIPTTIAFLPELPKGLTGKIHRKTLKQIALQQLAA